VPRYVASWTLSRPDGEKFAHRSECIGTAGGEPNAPSQRQVQGVELPEAQVVHDGGQLDTALQCPVDALPHARAVELLAERLQIVVHHHAMVLEAVGATQLALCGQRKPVHSPDFNVPSSVRTRKLDHRVEQPICLLRDGHQRVAQRGERYAHEPVPEQPTPHVVHRQPGLNRGSVAMTSRCPLIWANDSWRTRCQSDR